MRRRDLSAAPPALLAVLLASCFLLGATPAAAAEATPQPGAEPAASAPPSPARISLGGIRPAVARPGTDVTVTGVVTAAEDLRSLTARVRVRRSVTARVQLANAAAATELAGTPTEAVRVADVLGTGARARFTLTVPAALLVGGPDVTVRILRVELSAAAPGGGTRRVGALTTFVPWAPATEVSQATELAVVWPLRDSPHRIAGDVFADDRLTAEIAPGGRLRTILDSSAGWTLALDPMLAEDLAVMAGADGYLVAQPAGAEPLRRPRNADAVSALDTLRQRAATPGALDLLPYADVDVAALVAARREPELVRAVRQARTVAARVLDADLRVRVALPQVDGLAPATVAAMSRAGVRAVVLPSEEVPSDPEANFTPTARTTVTLDSGVSTDAVLSDSALTALVAGPTDRAAALARLLAETAMHTAELPGRPRALAIVLPRDWTPTPAYARALRAALGSALWVVPTPLDTMLEGTPDPEDRREAAPTPASAPPPLNRPYLQRVVEHTTAGQDFSRVLAKKKASDELYTDYADERLRLESIAATGPVGVSLLDLSDARLAARTRLIRVVTNGRITIPGSQSFPLTIRNDSDQAVRVAVSFGRSARVALPTSKVIRIEPRSQGGGAQRIDVTVKATANGPADVSAQLITPRGRVFGSPQPIRLTVRGAGGPAKAVVGLAGGVFVVALAARILRRRRPDKQTATP